MKENKLKGWPPKYISAVSLDEYQGSRGDDVIDFAEALCKITKDSVAGNSGEPLIFRDWQKELTRNLFAVKDNGKLKHKIALIGLPRKQGKSAWLSSIALEHLVLGPQGGEIYSCAADRDQAKIVFGTVKEMIRLEPELQFLQVYRDAIYNPKNGTSYRALSAEAFTKEGLSPTFVAFDELHAQPNRELFDVMSLAMGARQDPMLVAITTAGVKVDSSGKDSLCYDLYNYGKRIVSGEVNDPSFFFAWYEGNDLIDYRTEEAWLIANPGYGDICAADDFASAVLRTPEAEVLRFIQDCKVANERNQQSIRDAVYIRNTVYEFFNSQYSPGDQDITTSVEEINEMLRSINADELKRTWSASVRIYVNVSGIEATNKEEVVDMIQDDINVELQSIDGEIWVDDIEVNDVSPE